MTNDTIAHIKIKKISAGEWMETEDQLAVEAPLEIALAWQQQGIPIQRNIAVTMRTPGHDEQLAAGFLFTEGMLQGREQIQQVQHRDDHILFTLAPGMVPDLTQAERNFMANSSCGVCGKTDAHAIRTISPYQHTPDHLHVDHAILYELQQTIQQEQVLFESTGGIHAAALFNSEGQLIRLHEDIGRHNALDKVIGAAFLQNQLPLHKHVLLLSGRAGFELIQKAYMAGIRLIAAVGAPSSMAVQVAAECGITLIGFLRKDRFNVYSHEKRLRF
jgi:FdhD protein